MTGGMMRGETSLRIKAPAERLWQMVADVPRMGEWSPECRRAEWLAGAGGPTVGARFRGHNQLGPAKWSTVSTVKVAEPGREFAFAVSPTGIVWRYRFEPNGDATTVTESFETPPGSRVMDVLLPLIGRKKKMEAGMRRTLEQLKAAAEKV